MQRQSIANESASDQAKPTGMARGTPEVIFANWREALHNSGLVRPVQGAYEIGVARFLEYCVLNGQSVTRQSASNFLADAHRRGLAPVDGRWEQGVDWFFVNGQERCAPQREGVPSIGRADTGKSGWESRMIERLRLQHYSCRTEQTYREWARRFAQHAGGGDLSGATTEHVKGFLTDLAEATRDGVRSPLDSL